MLLSQYSLLYKIVIQCSFTLNYVFSVQGLQKRLSDLTLESKHRHGTISPPKSPELKEDVEQTTSHKKVSIFMSVMLISFIIKIAYLKQN